MLEAEKLPARVTNLATGLAKVDKKALAHVVDLAPSWKKKGLGSSFKALDAFVLEVLDVFCTGAKGVEVEQEEMLQGSGRLLQARLQD